PDRQLHHVARDGRHVDHAAAPGRRADAPVGRAGAHAGAAMGDVVLDAGGTRRWLERLADTLEEHAGELTQLDAAIGDADHGTNMARGFRAVRERVLGGGGDADVSALLRQTGMALIATVGGAGGPLYGTLFLRMAQSAAGKDGLTLA